MNKVTFSSEINGSKLKVIIMSEDENCKETSTVEMDSGKEDPNISPYVQVKMVHILATINSAIVKLSEFIPKANTIEEIKNPPKPSV